MNILFIHPVMFHPQRGGIERVSDLLCREFIRRGHHVLCLHSVRDESRMDYALSLIHISEPTRRS